jgi:hypothetical protein
MFYYASIAGLFLDTGFHADQGCHYDKINLDNSNGRMRKFVKSLINGSQSMHMILAKNKLHSPTYCIQIFHLSLVNLTE